MAPLQYSGNVLSVLRYCGTLLAVQYDGTGLAVLRYGGTFERYCNIVVVFNCAAI